MTSKLPPNFPVIKGNFEELPVKVQDFVAGKVKLCNPDDLYICDGSKEENEALIKLLMDDGILTPLAKHDNWYVHFFCKGSPYFESSFNCSFGPAFFFLLLLLIIFSGSSGSIRKWIPNEVQV